MKHLTKKDIKNLKIGTKLRLAGSGNFMTTEVVYTGIFENGLGSNLHTFVELRHGRTVAYTISTTNMPDIPTLNSNFIFWNYEDACEYSRESFCDLIEHYNNHQFKNNPIKV